MDPKTISEQGTPRPVYASSQYDQDRVCSSIVAGDSVSSQRRSWSDSANAQTDLDLRCPQMA